MKISYKNILSILISAIFIGLFYNILNPKGIPLIKEKRELVFENDSLIHSIAAEKENLNLDSTLNSPIVDTTEEKKSNAKNEVLNQNKLTDKIEPFTEPKAIKIDLAYKLFKQGVKFIDARMPDDYQAGHIKGAYNIPFDGDERYREILNNFSKDEILVVYCSGTDCDLSIYLGREIFEKGFKRVYIFFGGWNEWLGKNYPIERGTNEE
jgi:rhodanese-related sulfurtransferase